MRSLYSFAILVLTAAPAFAISGDAAINLPEPSVIGLIGIGALAFLIGRRGKK